MLFYAACNQADKFVHSLLILGFLIMNNKAEYKALKWRAITIVVLSLFLAGAGFLAILVHNSVYSDLG